MEEAVAMRHALWCRVKFALWLVMFLAPVAVAAWSRQIDQTLADTSYLPPLDPAFASIDDAIWDY
jgi:hypothetical protein